LRYVFPHGEDSKQLAVLTDLLEYMAKNSVTRTDMIAALGGGVTGDLAGFAASVYLRGVPYIQMPTTLLAAVDSSVGGKTAVNLSAGKNLCGAFYQPRLVICDCAAFETLSPEIFADGVSESVKYGVIADSALFERFAEEVSRTSLSDIVKRCVEIKSMYVADDEFDTGVRQYLNFGHTIGHAIEKCSGFGISHGHAVAIGMAIVSKAADALGLTDRPIAHEVCDVLLKNSLPVTSEYSPSQLARAALSDKKRRGGSITLVLPKEIGRAELEEIPVTELEKFISAGMEECV